MTVPAVPESTDGDVVIHLATSMLCRCSIAERNISHNFQ